MWTKTNVKTEKFSEFWTYNQKIYKMGSGNNNRKKSDNVIIRIPKANLGVGGRIEEVAEVCIPSFDVLLNPGSLTQDGVKVELKMTKEGILITIGGVEVGHLAAAYSAMVTKCARLGVKYRGEVIIKKEKKYARFNRSAK